MTDINQDINLLHDKLQLLIKAYKQLQKEHKKSLKEIDTLQKEQVERNDQLLQLEQKVTTAQIVGVQGSNDQKQALQKKIDKYLKEIDKCLALLHA